MISMIIGSLNHRITELAMKNRICCEAQNLTEVLFLGEKATFLSVNKILGWGEQEGGHLCTGPHVHPFTNQG